MDFKRAIFSVLILLSGCSYTACAAEECGTLQIVARYTAGSHQRHTFMGMGDALVFVEGQDAKLEADQIFFDETTSILEARGHIKLTTRDEPAKAIEGPLKFDIHSTKYLLTEPGVVLSGPKMITLAPEDISR